MKKLMTMLAAVATAFGLYAADEGFISGAGFDSTDVDGTAKLTWTHPSGFVDGFWTGTNAENAVITAGDCGLAAANRPAAFQNDDPDAKKDGYLTINESKGLISQKIQAVGKKEIDAKKGLYFDGLVQFTAFDEMPTIASDAKIAVFPMLDDPNDESKGASLWIYSAGGTNFWKTAKPIEGGWYRVTIKMINNILKSGSQVGFVVYVNGVAVECTAAQAAFADPTALTAEAKSYYDNEQLFGAVGTYSAEMTEVAFGGKGAIDEIAFTEKAPTFAESPTFYTVGWNTATVASVTELATNPQDVQVTGQTATYTYTAQDGYISSTTSFVGVAGQTYTITAAKLGASVLKWDGEKWAAVSGGQVGTFAEALAKVDNSGKFKIELGQDEGAITINKAGCDLTIDLMGKKIASVSEEVSAIAVNAGKLTIIDSDGNGVVQGVDLQDGSFSSALALPEEPVEGTVSLAINGGTFFGSIDYTTEDNTTIALDGAKFDAGSNTDPSDDSCLVGGDIGEGNEWVLADSFWSVQEIQKIDIKDAVVTASATYGDTAPVVTVKLNETTIDSENYDLAFSPEYDATTPAGTKITVTVTAKGDTYTGTASGDFTVEKQALTVSVSLDVTEATFDAAKTAPGDYATPTITGLDGVDAGEYTAAWNPTEVTAEGGEFTYTVTAKQDGNYTFEPASATLTIKKAEPEYPEDWPEADDDVKEAFKAWKAENPGADLSDPLMQNRFLLNLAATAEVPELEITSIVVEGTTATIKVAAGKIDLDQINGVIFVETSENLSTWTPTAVTGEVTEKVWTGSVTAPFIKAKVGFKVPK